MAAVMLQLPDGLKRRCAGWVGAIGIVASLASCAGSRQGLDPNELDDLRPARGVAAAAGWGAYDLYENQKLQRYVDLVGAKLAAEARLKGPPLQIRIVDAPTPNATAGRDNVIYVTLGLLSLLIDEAELAWVLSHEIGHLELDDAALLSAMRRGEANRNARAFAAFERRLETSADQRGIELMRSAGYDVTAARRVALRLNRSRSNTPYLATHPNALERTKTLPRQSTGERGAARFLRALEGARFSAPGYLTTPLRDGVVVAPSLKLVIEPPEGFTLKDSGEALDFASADGAIRIRLRVMPPSDTTLRAALETELHPSFRTTTGAGALTDVAAYTSFGGREAVAGRSELLFGDVKAEARLSVISGKGRRYFSLTLYPATRRAEAEAALARLEAGIRPITPEESALLAQFTIGKATLEPNESFDAWLARIGGAPVREEFVRYFNGLSPSEPLPVGRMLKVVLRR